MADETIPEAIERLTKNNPRFVKAARSNQAVTIITGRPTAGVAPDEPSGD
jgi:hypothetical protein